MGKKDGGTKDGPKKKKWHEKPDSWAVLCCSVGALLLAVSMFVPYWRVGDGTEAVEQVWDFMGGFESRSYGLIQVKSSYSQTWRTLTQQTCDYRGIAVIENLGNAAVGIIGGDLDACRNTNEGSQSCAQGFSAHMNSRCDLYNRMMSISYVTLGLTFCSILMSLVGGILAALSKRHKTGGFTFGLFLIAGIFALVGNIAWGAVTDAAFKELAETAWFPYPSFGVAFYLSLVGSLMLLIANGVFGYVVLPRVWKYDPLQEKYERRQAVRKKAAARKEKEMQNFPPPPGMPMGMANGGYENHYGGDFGLEAGPTTYGQEYYDGQPLPLQEGAWQDQEVMPGDYQYAGYEYDGGQYPVDGGGYVDANGQYVGDYAAAGYSVDEYGQPMYMDTTYGQGYEQETKLDMMMPSPADDAAVPSTAPGTYDQQIYDQPGFPQQGYDEQGYDPAAYTYAGSGEMYGSMGGDPQFAGGGDGYGGTGGGEMYAGDGMHAYDAYSGGGGMQDAGGDVYGGAGGDVYGGAGGDMYSGGGYGGGPEQWTGGEAPAAYGDSPSMPWGGDAADAGALPPAPPPAPQSRFSMAPPPMPGGGIPESPFGAGGVGAPPAPW